MSKKLKVSDLMSITLDFINGKITQEDFASWGDSLESITNTLPIEIKTAILIDLMNNYYYKDSIQEELISELYMNIFFKVYLRYIGVQDVDESDINYDNYNILEPIFGSWIETFAERDIRTFKEMIFNNVQFYNTRMINDSIRNIDIETLNKSIESNKELIETLEENRDLINDLSKISAINDPAVADLVNTIRENAVKEAKQ